MEASQVCCSGKNGQDMCDLLVEMIAKQVRRWAKRGQTAKQIGSPIAAMVAFQIRFTLDTVRLQLAFNLPTFLGRCNHQRS